MAVLVIMFQRLLSQTGRCKTFNMGSHRHLAGRAAILYISGQAWDFSSFGKNHLFSFAIS